MLYLVKFFTSAFFFLLSLGQFAKIPFFEERLYFFDIFALFYVFFFFWVVLKNKLVLRINFVFFLLLAFSFFASFSLFLSFVTNSYPNLLFQAFYLVRWFLYLFSAFALFSFIRLDFLDFKWFLHLILKAGFLISVFGFIQLLLLPDFTVLSSDLGWDPHKNRLASTFFDPNFAGAYLAICLSIFLGKIYAGDLSFKKDKKQFLLYFLIPMLALFLTFSRSAWGMFAVIIFIYGILRYRFLLFLFVLIAFLSYFAVPRVQTRLSGITDPADSASFRLISWKSALEVFETSPLFGVGFNSYRYAQKELGNFDPGSFGGNSGAGVDSSFLFVLVTTGILGFGIFCLGYLLSIFLNIRKLFGYKIISLTILISLFFESLFINSLFYPQILILWVFFSINYSLTSRYYKKS